MGKRYAVSIGINRYVNAKPINLRFACQDAEELTNLLRDRLRGGFDQVQQLLDEHATKVSIRQAVDDLLQSPLRQPDDLVLLFFSGHGVRDKQGDLCLVPSDFRYHVDGSIDFASLVHAKELEVSIGNSNVQNVVLLIDCCHSGALGNVMGRTVLSEDTNLFLIGAARSSEPAVEVEPLQHGAFTECLLRALNLPPDKGEWVTLGRIAAFIGDEIKKLGTTQLVQSTSRYVDIGIPIARNPSYSTYSKEFTREVAGIFQLANYDIEFQHSHYDYPNFFIAKLRTGFRPSQIGVLCLDNRQVKVAAAHIAQFVSMTRQLHASYDIANGMLVTCNDLPSSVREEVEALEIASWSTSAGLLRNLIDFTRYLHRLIAEFDQDGLDRPGEPAPIKYYVELEAEIEDGKEGRKLAIDHIQEWCSKRGGPQLALLGEYGSGKTTLCKKLARDLAQRHLQAGQKKKHRIPIMLPLGKFPRGRADIEAFIAGHLAGRCGVSNPSPEAFKAMNDAGFLLLIFDGFDEMAAYADEDTIYANLAQIEQLAASPNSRVLLTSRPEYFKTFHEEEEMLQPTGLLARRSKYRRLHLCRFGERQIRSYLQKRIPLVPNATQDWSYYHNQIRRIHDLSDLSSRPVLLEMIVKTLPELVAKDKPINRPMLYQTYLEGELQRQSIEKRRELLIKHHDRLRMMQTLALHLYMEQSVGLTADLVQILVHDQMSRDQLDELEAHTRDFLTCSFLTRQRDTFSFSHRSFVEYLTARALFEEAETNVPRYFGKRRLTKEVIDFLVELEPNRDALREWIGRTRHRTFESVKYLGTNSMVVLVRLKEDPRYGNFAGAVLREADLREVDFTGAVFAQGDLSNSDLTRAVLDHCNFTEADLTKAKMASVNAHNCNFKGAYFDLTDLTGCDLSGSDLRECICYEANFQGVLADNCKVSRLDGILNPSSSLKLLVTDMRGPWIELPKTGYEGKLWIVDKRADRVSGKLQTSPRTWVEFRGSLQRGRYMLQGTEYIEERFVVTKQFLEDLEAHDLSLSMIVLTELGGWRGRVFRSQTQFLSRLETELDRLMEDIKRLKRESGKEGFDEYIDANPMYIAIVDLIGKDRLIERDIDFDAAHREIEKLEKLMNLESLALEKAAFEIGRYTGWMTLSPGDDNKLLLYLTATSRASGEENPRIFQRPSK